ncbi:hypothetical protein L248_2250 [Schleiferilactobacillus shenzhenensis LY-73]|uniref:Uncharacterized protein n=1 Tax=Schleiferilactobacillus shenzhenensis LY-73 TaxID=1231336 RepID=U4TK14_9LACO|nr:hypothetical protein L248_2250 [Schleiferilactobacillus shenzhenensis LY-73]
MQVNTDSKTTQGQAFYMTLSPNETQNVEVSISNLTGEENVIRIQPSVGSTDGSGQLDVSNVKAKPDVSMKYPFTDMFMGPDTVTLPAHSAKVVPISIKAPEGTFPGLIMGGLVFSSQNLPVSQSSSSRSGKQMKNNVRYAIPVGIRSKGSTQQRVAPDLDLGEPSLISGVFNHPAVTVNVRDIKPAILRHLKGTVNVYQTDSPTNSFRFQTSTLEMAPNSIYAMQIPWGTNSVSAGTYTVEFQFASGERNWHFSRTLIVSPHRAESVNQTSAASHSNWEQYIAIGIVLLFLLVLSVTILVWHRGKARGARNTQ